MIRYAFIMLFGAFIASCSQIILKKAAERKYSSKIAEYLNPMVIGAYIVFFSATLCTVYGYKEVPLSLGPIFDATGYIWVAIFGRIFLKEKIGVRKATGLIVIVLGIAIAAGGTFFINILKSFI